MVALWVLNAASCNIFSYDVEWRANWQFDGGSPKWSLNKQLKAKLWSNGHGFETPKQWTWCWNSCLMTPKMFVRQQLAIFKVRAFQLSSSLTYVIYYNITCIINPSLRFQLPGFRVERFITFPISICLCTKQSMLHTMPPLKPPSFKYKLFFGLFGKCVVWFKVWFCIIKFT